MKPTREQMLEAAEKLKNLCENMECDECPFDGGDYCMLESGVPNDFPLENL